MDEQSAIGLIAAPAIISGVLGIVNWSVFDRFTVVSDAKRAAAILLGVGYGLLAWQADIIDAENAVVAGLLGVTAGLGAIGWRHAISDRAGIADAARRLTGTGG